MFPNDSQFGTPKNLRPHHENVACEAGTMDWSYDAADEMSSDSYSHSDPATDDAQHQVSLHTVASQSLTLPERVSMDVLGIGMNTYPIHQINAHSQEGISYINPMGADDSSWNGGNWCTSMPNDHLDPRILEDPHDLTPQDMAQIRTSPLPLLAAAGNPSWFQYSTTPNNTTYSVEQSESQLLSTHSSSYPANMELSSQVMPMRPGLTWAGVPSEEPWMPPTVSMPIPHLQIDVLQSSSISPYLHYPRAPQIGLSPTVDEDTEWFKGKQGQFSKSRESSTGTSRRGSFLSAPGNLENVQGDIPSPTPSEIVTPSVYPDPLPCVFGDCQTKFNGLYRRGNQLRHTRLVHNAVEYPCGARDCNRTFKRKDARLKHRRAYHTDEFPDLKPPSIRKQRGPSQEF